MNLFPMYAINNLRVYVDVRNKQLKCLCSFIEEVVAFNTVDLSRALATALGTSKFKLDALGVRV